MPRRFVLVLSLACSLSAGCVQVTVRPNPKLVPRPLPTTFDNKDWATVLRDHVKGGLVDYDGLTRDRDPLDRYYALISAMGPNTAPDQFPTRSHKMAYGINAFNALVLCAVLEDANRPSMYDIAMPPFESGPTFLLDGVSTTLRALEDRLLRESNGDVRVIFALSRAAMGGPGLGFEPYRAELIERQLQEAAANALDNPHLFQVDHQQHAVFVWLAILERQNEFFDYWQARRRTRAPTLLSVLADMGSPRCRQSLSRAVGYAVRIMPFDRRLNRWGPLPGGGAAGRDSAVR